MTKLSVLLIGGFINLWLYLFGLLMCYVDLSMIVRGYNAEKQTFQMFFGSPKSHIKPTQLSKMMGRILIGIATLMTAYLIYYGVTK